MAVEIAQLLSSCLAGMKEWIRSPEPGAEWRVGEWYPFVCLWCLAWEGRDRQIPGACRQASLLFCSISGHRVTLSQNQKQNRTKKGGQCPRKHTQSCHYFVVHVVCSLSLLAARSRYCSLISSVNFTVLGFVVRSMSLWQKFFFARYIKICQGQENQFVKYNSSLWKQWHAKHMS